MDKEMILKIERERKREYRLRKKIADTNGTVLVRLRKGAKSPVAVSSYKNPNPNPILDKLQKKRIDYDGIILRLTLKEGDKIDTIKLYLDRIDRLYRALFRVYLNRNNINLLEKNDEIILFLDDTYNTYTTSKKDGEPTKNDKDRGTLETMRSYINAILVITDRMGDITIKEKYKDISIKLNKQYQSATDSNIISIHEKEQWIHWNDITKLVDKSFKSNLLNNQEKIITILYSDFIAPRRIADYQHMKIIKYNTRNSIPKHILKKAEEDLTNNYMIVSSNNLVRRIVFNNYKTKNTYGQIIVGNEINKVDIDKNYFYLEPSIVKKLQHLITNKNDGDYLLTRNDNEPYTQPELTQLVLNTFKKITNKQLTCNMLRKIFITEQIINNPKLSIETKRNMGKYMGHSIKVQETYNRVMDGINPNDIHLIRKAQFGLGLN